MHSAHVETTLLSQARVAAVGQELALWVLGRTLVRLKVGAWGSSMCHLHLLIMVPVSVAPSSKTNALLLGTDTEVVVAPKTRAPLKPSNGHAISGQQSAGTESSTTPAPESSTPITSTKMMRVIPAVSWVATSPNSARIYVSRAAFMELTGCALTDLLSHDRKIASVEGN